MPDTAFSEEKLCSVLSTRIPGFEKLNTLERLSGGASQETYRILIETSQGTQQLAMRRAAGGTHVSLVENYPGLAIEAKLMLKAREAGVPEPQLHYVLQPEDELGEGFIMEWIDGYTLGAKIVRAPELAQVRPKLAYLCGQTLAKIHAIDLSKTGLDNDLKVVTPRDYIEQTWERYQAFNTPQPMIDYTAQWLLRNLPEGVELSLVHNDFRNGNIMVSEQGIVAVLDWELAHIGDPMRDLGWICTNSWRFGRSDLVVGGFGELADLIAGYEQQSGTTVDIERIKFWQIFGSFWWAVGCLGMAEHFRNGPDKTVERPAIGRRSSECQVDCVNLLIPGPVELLSGADEGQFGEMPGISELLASVTSFLRDEVMDQSEGRTRFLARVAANSLDIVLRDAELGAAARAAEHGRLVELLDANGSLAELRWQLVEKIRSGHCDLEDVLLKQHLRQTVVNQLAIDQPSYSGLQAALRAKVDMD